MTKTLLLDCGSGGRASQRLINELFLEQFDNPILRTLDDAAKLDMRDVRRVEGRFDLVEQAAAARALAAEMNQNLFAALRADEVADLPLGVTAKIDVGGRVKFKIAHGKNLQL